MAVFEKAIPGLNRLEGGYQKIESDPGNYNSLGELVGTKYGISARFYESVIGRPPSQADMMNITRPEATGIYEEHFWDFRNISQISNQLLANQVFDIWVNHSVATAKNLLNKAADKLGISGSDWLEKYTKAKEPVKLNDTLARMRADWMRTESTAGWRTINVNRALSFLSNNALMISIVLAATTTLLLS